MVEMKRDDIKCLGIIYKPIEHNLSWLGVIGVEKWETNKKIMRVSSFNDKPSVTEIYPKMNSKLVKNNKL